MKKITIEDYKAALKAQYSVAESENQSGLLTQPSPANLKRLCMLKWENKPDMIDQGILKHFFKFSDDENSVRQMERFDTDKFRPVQSFLIGKTGDTQLPVLNLIALLVDLKPRPYIQFAQLGEKKGIIQHTEESVTVADSGQEAENDAQAQEGGLNPKKDSETLTGSGDSEKSDLSNGAKAIKPPASNLWRKLLFFATILLLISIGFYSWKAIYPQSDCMVWKENSFVAISCSDVDQYGNPAERFDEEKLTNFHRIAVCDTTTFFRNEKPIVWYSKQGNRLEYFTRPGLHPVTGKALKDITRHIIEEHVPKCR